MHQVNNSSIMIGRVHIVYIAHSAYILLYCTIIKEKIKVNPVA